MSVPIMGAEEASKRTIDFCKSMTLRFAQLRSDFPKEYWGYFPSYMTSPFRVKVIVASNGIVIRFVRPSRRLRVTASIHRGRMETSIFPTLGGGKAMFHFENTVDFSIAHLTLAETEVAEVGPNVEVSIEDVRFTWTVAGQEQVIYEHLLWIFSPPATDTLNAELGSKKAISKFGGFLSWAIFDSKNPRAFELDYAKFLLSAAKRLEKQFASLTERIDVEEEELQEFLCDHRTLLTSSLGYELAECKVRLNQQDIVDFLLTSRVPSTRIFAVEIEPSHYGLVTATGEQTARLTGALDQARRYMKAVLAQKKNGVAQVKGLVVIGRSSKMDGGQKGSPSGSESVSFK